MEIDRLQVPSFDSMMKPMIQALQDLGGSASVETLDQKTIDLMDLDPLVRNIPHTRQGSDHRSEVSYRLAWARTYLKKYGILDNPDRGIWKLSDTFDGNVGALDPKAIVRVIRQQNLTAFKQQQAILPQMDTAQAFEEFVVSVLKDLKVAFSPVPQFSLGNDNRDLGFDIFLPQGLHPNDKPTFIETKSSLQRLSPHVITRYSAAVSMLDPEERFLLIIGEALSEKEKQAMVARLQEGSVCEVWVWDYNDLMAHSEPEPDYDEYLQRPQMALAKSAIRHRLGDDERRARKQERIDQLSQAYQQQNVTLFLGAGVSQESGLPSWNELIQRLLMKVVHDELQESLPDDIDVDQLGRLLGENATQNPLTQVRYISSLFSNKDEYSAVRDLLYARSPNLDTNLLRSICRLSKPERTHIGVKGIVSYNFDDLIEQSFQKSGIQHASIFRGKDIPSSSLLNIYHVHGYLPHDARSIDPEMTLVFSEEDYHKVYRDAFSWSNLTQLNAFRESTCVFIGCSMTDPNVRRLLDVYKQSCDKARHFAFLSRDIPKSKTWTAASEKLKEEYRKTDDSVRDDYFLSIGINVIWVDSFDEIPDILDSLPK